MNRELKFKIWDAELEKMFDPIDLKFGLNNLEDGQFLLQCTGLKDKNNKDIYEGDIIKRGAIRRVVKWNTNRCQCGFNIGKGYDYNKVTDTSLEVVGNIYQNPELLK